MLWVYCDQRSQVVDFGSFGTSALREHFHFYLVSDWFLSALTDNGRADLIRLFSFIPQQYNVGSNSK